MIRCASIALLVAAAGSAQAQLINVNPSTVIPAFGTPWYSTGNTPSGSSAITSYIGIDGDGAAQIRGDRTRFAIGNIFPSNSSPLPNVGLLSDVTAFSYQWNTVSVGAGIPTAQAPVLRLHVLDPVNNRRVEFIWEDGEQSVPQFVGLMAPVGTLGTVYSGNFFTGRVYAFTGGLGRGIFNGSGVLIPGSDSALPFSNLISILGVPTATVAGVSVGVGSGVGSGFEGYADTVTLQFGTSPALQMNFVPTPGAAALLGLAGLAATRRRR
jgi:hypothetical protein